MSLENDRGDRADRDQRNKCHKCNSFISQQFARVFGDNDDRAHACIRCSTLHSLRDGDAGEADG
jgi:hypothetical protein